MAAIDPDLRTRIRHARIVEKQPIAAIVARFGVSDTTIRRHAHGTCEFARGTAMKAAQAARAERIKLIPKLSKKYPKATATRIAALADVDPTAVLAWRRSVGIPVISRRRRDSSKLAA